MNGTKTARILPAAMIAGAVFGAFLASMAGAALQQGISFGMLCGSLFGFWLVKDSLKRHDLKEHWKASSVRLPLNLVLTGNVMMAVGLFLPILVGALRNI